MKNTEEMDATSAQGQNPFDPDNAKALSPADERLGCDHRDLVPILAFFRQEVDESAAILRDLAERLSQALYALGNDDGRRRRAIEAYLRQPPPCRTKTEFSRDWTIWVLRSPWWSGR